MRRRRGRPHTHDRDRLRPRPVRRRALALSQIFATGAVPPTPPAGYAAFDEQLPRFSTSSGVNQTAAQPCYARTVADLPIDGTACANRILQPFVGTEAYYSSGFIPFEGVRGNTFDLPIAADAKPGTFTKKGTYPYACIVHPGMIGKVVVS